MICSHLSAFEALALLGAFLSGHQLGVLEPTHTEALVSCQDGGGNLGDKFAGKMQPPLLTCASAGRSEMIARCRSGCGCGFGLGCAEVMLSARLTLSHYEHGSCGSGSRSLLARCGALRDVAANISAHLDHNYLEPTP